MTRSTGEASFTLQPTLPRKLDFDSLIPTSLRLGAIGVVVSLLYSLLRLQFDPLINPDAVYYLIAAEEWIENGVDAALAIYWRPFYSILIGGFALITSLSTLASAHVIDALFAAALLVAVQLLIRELGGDVRTQAVGLVLFLLLPSMHEYRTMIGRDLGYWTAAVAALIALIRYARSGHVLLMGLFYGAVLVAMLFRPEAVLLLLLPFTLAIRRGARDQIRTVIIAQVPLLLICLLLAMGTLVSNGVNEFVAGVLQESVREPLRLLETIPSRFSDLREAFGDGVLHAEFHDYAVIGLIAGVVAIVVSHLSVAIGWPILLIAGFGLRRELLRTLDPDALRLAAWTIAIITSVLCVFLVISPVMQTRFLMLPAFMVLALAAFAVGHVHRKAIHSGHRNRFRWVAGVIVGYLIFEAWCSMEHSKTYILDAADLIRQEAATDATVLSNDARIAYLSGRSFDLIDVLGARQLAEMSPQRRRLLEANYDYWAVHLRAGSPYASGLLDVMPGWREIGRTANRKGDQVMVLVSPRRDDGLPVTFTETPPDSCWVCCWFGLSRRLCSNGGVGSANGCGTTVDPSS